MRTLELFIPGLPAPQGSKSRGRYGGIYETGADKLNPWRDAVRCDVAGWIGRNHEQWAVLDEAIHARLRFVLPRPKSLPRKVVHHIRKPDADKLVRAAFDAITMAGYWRDDSCAESFQASKRYARSDEATGLHLFLSPVVDLERASAHREAM